MGRNLRHEYDVMTVYDNVMVISSIDWAILVYCSFSPCIGPSNCMRIPAMVLKYSGLSLQHLILLSRTV